MSASDRLARAEAEALTSLGETRFRWLPHMRLLPRPLAPAAPGTQRACPSACPITTVQPALLPATCPPPPPPTVGSRLPLPPQAASSSTPTRWAPRPLPRRQRGRARPLPRQPTSTCRNPPFPLGRQRRRELWQPLPTPPPRQLIPRHQCPQPANRKTTSQPWRPWQSQRARLRTTTGRPWILPAQGGPRQGRRRQLSPPLCRLQRQPLRRPLPLLVLLVLLMVVLLVLLILLLLLRFDHRSFRGAGSLAPRDFVRRSAGSFRLALPPSPVRLLCARAQLAKPARPTRRRLPLTPRLMRATWNPRKPRWALTSG